MRHNHTPPLSHTVADACHRLGVGKTLFYKLIADGEIATFKLGARTLVLESELQRLIESRFSGRKAA